MAGILKWRSFFCRDKGRSWYGRREVLQERVWLKSEVSTVWFICTSVPQEITPRMWACDGGDKRGGGLLCHDYDADWARGGLPQSWTLLGGGVKGGETRG